jgi:poly(3-hydroxybutyrate) depolymerase
MGKSKITLLVLSLSLGVITACLVLFYSSTGCRSGSDFTTGERTITSHGTEREYFLKLPDNYDSNTPYPLVFGFHGLTSDYTSFTDESSNNLHSAVGEEAILVYPNALPDDNDVTKWDYSDLEFFDDLFAELEANLCFDTRKVFAVGHSNGAGFSHTLGCQRGDVLRAIGPVAGSLNEYSDCIGQVAVVQINGGNDTWLPPGMARPSRDYWAAINSCKKEETDEGVNPSCDAYGSCDTKFPVQYCEHSGGHEWPEFAGDAIWSFFKGLPEVAPSDKPGDGDVENIGKGVINFKIHYRSDFVGEPDKLALTLRPPGVTPPFYTAPSYVLNSNVPVTEYQLGEITEYNDVEISLSGVDYGDYTIALTVYVVGSNYPIPTTGLDYTSLQNITIDSTTLTVEDPFELEFVQSF